MSQSFILPGDLHKLQVLLKRLEGTEQDWLVKISRYRETRTIKQQSMLWGIYRDIAAHIGGDTTAEDVHEAMTQMFLPRRRTAIATRLNLPATPVSTKELDTVEFSEYVEKICRFWAETDGLYLG